MKKIILLIFLVLFSCTKNQETKNIEDINVSSIKTEKIAITDDGLILEKEKISKDIIDGFSNLSLYEQVDYKCEDIHPVYDGMSQKAIKNRDDFISKCNLLKQQSIKVLQKKEDNFKVTDCEKIIKSQNRDIKDFDEKFYLPLIQTCEMSIAIKNGCETLKDEIKVKKCSEYKDLKEKNDNLKMIENFDIKSLL